MKTRSESEDRAWMQSRKRLTLQLAMSLLYLGAAVAAAQTLTVLHNFNGNQGANPDADLAVSDSTLYGMTCGGIVHGFAVGRTVFKVHTDGSDFNVLHAFPGASAEGPTGGLVLYSNTVYGTRHSINSSWGMVFKVNTDGSGFAVLKDFSGGDGASPCGALVASNSTLYGTTAGGGYQSFGTVFKINTDGSNYTILKDFGRAYQWNDGASPKGGLVLSGTTLYGTADHGGISNCGTVFKVNTDGSDFAVLHHFIGKDGANPYAGLVISGTTLYGTTREGGIDYRGPNYGSYGTVFKVNTDGTGYTVLKDFSGGSDGAWPQSGLVLLGTTLFGTTVYSGLHFDRIGKVFKINTDGSGFTVLGDLEEPCARMALSGTVLYGTTFRGGILGYGTVFSLSITPPTIVAFVQSQTAEAGSTVALPVTAAGAPLLTYQWFFNGTNAITCANSCLVLTNVQFFQSGVYTVVVTNLFGAVTSAPAMLNVILPVERRPVPGINLTGEAGSSLNVEFTDAVAPPKTWLPLATVSLASPPQFYFDLSAQLPPQRFYRAWQFAPASMNPSLDLHMIPAITLAGNPGDSVRVDGINAVGPIDAWFTLDTVTLTNTPQLYFDVSVIGQPPRLYRLIPVP